MTSNVPIPMYIKIAGFYFRVFIETQAHALVGTPPHVATFS